MLKIANHCHYHKQLAREYIEQIQSYPLASDILLHIEDELVQFCSVLNQQKACSNQSFQDSKLLQRASQSNQSLIKACNNKKREIKSVLDLTAGWGKDSFMLASQGLQVCMLEQNPLIFHTLEYLLKTARINSDDARYQRLEVLKGNSLEYMQDLENTSADCIYLDPMFPDHKSGAKPSKDLQILQLLTENLDIESLFEQALKRAKYRVVVKRPLHATALNDRKPDMSYKEKTIRFDVYLTFNR